MNIAQLVNTVVPPKGWRITHRLGEVHDTAMDVFRGVCPISPPATPIYALDRSSGVYVLSRAISTKDDYGRDAGLTHGFIFTESQSEEAFSNYAGLLGIQSFLSSYTESATQITDLSAISFTRQLPEGFRLHGLMACVYKALAEEKSLVICLPTDDEANTMMRSVLHEIYAYLPLSFRRFITFESQRTGRGRKISFSSTCPQDGTLYFDAGSGRFSDDVEDYYQKLASEVLAHPEANFKIMEACAKETFARLRYTTKAVRESMDKLLFTCGYRGIEAGTEKLWFSKIMENALYKDNAYAGLLVELLDGFYQSGHYDADVFGKLISAYADISEPGLKQTVLSFVLVFCLKMSAVDCGAVLQKAKESSAFYVDFLTELFQNEDYAGLRPYYVNLCLASEKESGDALTLLNSLQDRTVLDRMMAFLKNNIDQELLYGKEILQHIAAFSMEMYHELEEALFAAGKTELVVSLYGEYFLSKARTCHEILVLCDKLEKAGADYRCFVEASAAKFVTLCMEEHSDKASGMEPLVDEVCRYLNKAQLDPERYIAEIFVQYKRKYWKKFSWDRLDVTRDLSALYEKGNPLCENVAMVCALARAISQNTPLATLGIPLVAVACSDEYFSRKEKEIIAEKLGVIGNNLSDGDVPLFLHALNPKGFPLKEELISFDRLEAYINTCVETPDASHMLKDTNILIALFKYISRVKRKEPAQAERCEKMAEGLAQYAKASNDAKAMRAIEKMQKPTDYSKVGLCAVILSVFCLLKLCRMTTSSLYVYGVADTLGTLILLGCCALDALHPKKAFKQTIIALLMHCILVGIIGGILYVIFS